MKTKSSELEINLLDLQGRKIKTIVSGNFSERNHQINFFGEDLSKEFT